MHRAPPFPRLVDRGVKQVLGDVCIFYYMEDATFRQENIDFFCFFMWMKNPDLLPRSKVVSFFTQSPGRSSSSDGPPPMATALASSMIGGEVDLLIHLDHYYDWSPHLEGSSISDVSGLPASSSEASSSRPRQVYKSFTWYLGVVDGQVLGHHSVPRMTDPCHRLPSRDHHDDEPEDDGRGSAHHNWRSNINTRDRPADDLPRSGTQGMQQCMRSPRDGCRHGG
jgi:hypothetical protein